MRWIQLFLQIINVFKSCYKFICFFFSKIESVICRNFFQKFLREQNFLFICFICDEAYLKDCFYFFDINIEFFWLEFLYLFEILMTKNFSFINLIFKVVFRIFNDFFEKFVVSFVSIFQNRRFNKTWIFLISIFSKRRCAVVLIAAIFCIVVSFFDTIDCFFLNFEISTCVKITDIATNSIINSSETFKSISKLSLFSTFFISSFMSKKKFINFLNSNKIFITLLCNVWKFFRILNFRFLTNTNHVFFESYVLF